MQLAYGLNFASPINLIQIRNHTMGVFDVGVVAVIGAFAYAFYEQHTKTKVKLASVNSSEEQLSKEITELKQRVAVLESIVTDKSYQLKQEIERL